MIVSRFATYVAVIALISAELANAFTVPTNPFNSRRPTSFTNTLLRVTKEDASTPVALSLEDKEGKGFSAPKKVESRRVEEESGNSIVDKLSADLQMRYRIFQESKAAGYSFKQSMADVLAGEYDAYEINSELELLINSAPCVMFTWEASPSCKSAIKALDVAGAKVKVVRLDDPWDEGNPLRAELGKRVGRSSVPMIFIDGKYVGGYDGGVSDEAPGILDLAFQGKLRSMLEEAGSL